MLNKLIVKCVDLYIRIFARLHPLDSMVDIFSTIQRAEHILIYLPDNLEDFGVVRLFVSEIRNIFTNAKVTFIVRHNYFTLLDLGDRKGVALFSIKSEQINSFGLPRRQVIDAIQKIKYNVAIDLSNEISSLSSFVCYLSAAPLRICLNDPRRDAFFNFQIEVGKDTKLENKYRKLLNYISFRKVQTLAL
jgi:ADP-heptose:LPS heptosyltransferase